MSFDDNGYLVEEIEICGRKIAECFAEVTELLDSEPSWALTLFKEYIKSVKLPREPRRRGPPSPEVAMLMAEYDGSAQGTREAVLVEFESRYGLKQGTAKRTIMRYRKTSIARVFASYLKSIQKQGDS